MSNKHGPAGGKTVTGCLVRFAGAAAGLIWGMLTGFCMLILAATSFDLSLSIAVVVVVLPGITCTVLGALVPKLFGEFALELILSLFKRFS